MDDRTRDPFPLTIGGTKDSRTSLRVVDHKFVIGKEEYYPHVAEMHYFRVAKRHWSICFERIRRANFRIISTVVPWNLHEARQGEFDFSGSTDATKDLVVFLELCREFGFKIVLKPGPWIGSEWNNGGIPDFVVRNPDSLAVGRDGQPIMADPGAGARPAPLPSYLSNRFQIHLKNYYSVFGEVVKNYIYPRGPVFMIELDHETSFGGRFDPFSADFNAQSTQGVWSQFLAEKYGSLERLNRAWKAKHKDFVEAVFPDPAAAKSPGENHRLADWVEFREWTVNRYAEVLAELMSQSEISVLFARSLAYDGTYHFPDVAGSRTGGRVLFTVNLNWERPFAETVRHARSIAGWQPTGFCTSLAVGAGHADPEIGHQFRPIGARETKRLFVSALAAGLKGFNFHMFVGRSRWYDAALDVDGAILPSFDIIKDANFHLANLHYETMRDFADVALVQYRPYLRWASLGDRAPEGFSPELTGRGFEGLAADLMALGYDYRIFDLTVPQRLDKYGTVIMPCSEFMDPDSQEQLVALVRGGAHLILIGSVPKLDLEMEPCEILAKAIGFRTSLESAILTVESKHLEFAAQTYGTIRRTPTRAAKLAKSGAKLLAATNRSGKGQVTVTTVSPGSQLHPERLAFFHEILKSGKLTTPVFSSDPHVHVVLHAHPKAGLLMVYDTAETVGLAAAPEPSVARDVIIGADLSAAGLTAPKITLTDVLGTDTHRASPRDLKAGLPIRLGHGDSRLYSIERK